MGDDPPASILTNSHREYLKGERDSPLSNPRNYKSRIRRRIEWGIADMGTLFKHLDEEDRRKVFGPFYATTDDSTFAEKESPNHDTESFGEMTAVPGYTPSAFAFLMWALNIDGDPPYGPHGHWAFGRFERDLRSGIHLYLAEKWDVVADVDVSIEVSNVERRPDA